RSNLAEILAIFKPHADNLAPLLNSSISRGTIKPLPWKHPMVPTYLPGPIPTMKNSPRLSLCALAVCLLMGADWRQFRGPDGLATSDEKGLPLTWSSTENIVWKTPLPGPGTSSPVTVGNRIFLTCYSGYAVDAAKPGAMEDLKRHLLCLDRASGKVLWQK